MRASSKNGRTTEAFSVRGGLTDDLPPLVHASAIALQVLAPSPDSISDQAKPLARNARVGSRAAERVIQEPSRHQLQKSETGSAQSWWPRLG